MTETRLSIAQYIREDAVSARLNDLLGKRASQFITSLVAAANANKLLNTCKPESVVSAALIAASMDLPINQNLGFAYLIPYTLNRNKKRRRNGLPISNGLQGLYPTGSTFRFLQNYQCH